MKWLAGKQDAEAFLILSRLPNLPFFALTKPDKDSVLESKSKFFQHGTIPHFRYSRARAFDEFTYSTLLQKAEQQLARISLSHALRQVYEEKVQELRDRANLITAIKHQDDALVTQYSHILFTTPFLSTESLLTLFRTHSSLPGTISTEKTITTQSFIKAVNTLLEYYNISHFNIQIEPIDSIKIAHQIRNNRSIIHIPKSLALTKTRAIKLLTHEIEGHALRTMNGRNSPFAIFARGLPNSTLTEEGLALHLQHSIEDARTNYVPGLLDCIGIALAMNGTFTETFEQLLALRNEWSQKQHEEQKTNEELQEIVWRQVMRLYRGIHSPTEKGLVFSRDHMYFTGHEIVHKALNQSVSLRELYMGKIGLHHLPLFHDIDLDYVKVPELIGGQVVNREF